MEMGSIASSFTLFYGLSKFIGGLLSDLFSNRMLFVVGLALSGFSQIVFGLSSSLPIFCFVWALNGLVQGVGWPSLSGIVMNWFPKHKRGRAFAVLTASGNIGLVAAPFFLVRVIATFDKWQAGFFFEGILALTIAILAFLNLSDAPPSPASHKKTLGEPQIAPASSTVTNDERAPKSLGAKETSKSKAGFSEIFFGYIVQSPMFWALVVADIANYVALKSMSDWTLLYAMEARGLGEAQALALVTWMELGSICGNIGSGVASDFLGGRRKLTALLFSALTVPAFLVFYLGLPSEVGELFSGVSGALPLALTDLLPRMDCMCLFVMGMGMNGPRTLGPVAMREGMHSAAAGTATGLMGLAGQLGATFAGAPVGILTEQYGWAATMSFILACLCVVVSLYGLVSLSELQPSKKKKSLKNE
eukprot:CAMPEP_0117754592 /NCGR_PEP_ID=MMETSP0947-20121206/12916_1 /TAXON_ID=44440 /ORGANISM="Chattonella subsalsa, Strain CCMP2191" /LENGTH=418 /DNA_ID=CAMNT_0005573701 /DNA_START=391 /DNA_END=1647 /DNA_ORIENTATION=+